MKYLDFEKHIKNELEGSKETVQMDDLLASLNLGKQPKRKGFALWMIIPFLLITLSALAWKIMDYNQIELDEPSLTEVVSDSELIAETKADIHSESAFDSEVNTSAIDEDSELSNISISKENEDLKSTKRNTENPTTNYKTPIPSIKNNKTTPAVNIKPINEFQSDSKNLETGSTKSNSLNTSYLKREESNSKTRTTESSTENNNKIIASSSKNTRLSSRNVLSFANLDNTVKVLENQDVDGKLFSRMKINCPSFDNAGWHLALIPEVGLFLPMKTLESTALAEEKSGYAERLNSESTLEGIELGLYGMLVRDNVPFYLKAGVSYSRISERMDLKYSYTEIDTTFGIVSSTVSSNGDTITHVYGDIYEEIAYKGSNRQHHYIHLFDVPISVGYTTYLAGLDIGIEGGVKVNFMTRATGNLLTAKSEYTNLSLNRLFKNRIGVNFFGGLMIGRNFGKFGDIYIAPRFTYYPREFNNELNNVDQRYFTIGLNAGVVYKID